MAKVESHRWDVLAISCIDGRFVKRIADFVADKNANIFDFRSEVGCSKAILDSESDRERLFNVIETAVRLHSIKEVWLFDHIDCGAYGGSKEHADCDKEKEFHAEQLKSAAKVISDRFLSLQIKIFYVDWEKIEEIG